MSGQGWFERLEASWRPANELFSALDALDHDESGDRKPASDKVLAAQDEVHVQIRALAAAWSQFNEDARTAVEKVMAP